MVGEDDYQCPGMCLGVIQGHTHGVVEIPYFGEHTRCVVGVAHLVDERTLHHQEKAFSAAVVRHYFEGLGRGLREVFRRTAFGDGGDAVVVARIECHGPAFGNVVEFFEASDHEAAPLFELPDDARITLLQILTAAADQHVDVGVEQAEGHLLVFAAVHRMAEECPGGGVDDSGGNHYTRRHTAGIGFFEDGVQAVSRAVEPEPGVVGFPACGERRSRGGRVGYTIVGRMGLHESGHRSPLHLDRAVFVLDHQGRDVGQPHSVTDHQDYVFDLFGLLLFFRGFRSERRCGQQDRDNSA